MSRFFDYDHDFDGRPSVGDDPLFTMLMQVHGSEYALDLLVKDAAMRQAAEQAARRPKVAASQRRHNHAD